MKKLLFALAILLSVFSCKKNDFEKKQGYIEKQLPDYIELPQRQIDSIKSMNRLANTLSGENVIFIDFDGQTVTGTSWNVNGPIYAPATILSSADQATALTYVKERYSTVDVIVTTDSTVYWNANQFRRIRCIVTPYYQWYGNVGGVAILSSFTYGNNTPCWVFDTGGSLERIKYAIAHEVGHTLDCYHEVIWKADCSAVLNNYNPGNGTGATSWGPIMGDASGKGLQTFTYGFTSQSCTVPTDEYLRMNFAGDGSAQLPNRPDLVANDFTTDEALMNNNPTNYLLEYPTDVDMFLVGTHAQAYGCYITVTSYGTTDLAADVYDQNGTYRGSVDPSDRIDIARTHVGGILSGYSVKYIAIRNTTNNPNVPAGSLRGTYTAKVEY